MRADAERNRDAVVAAAGRLFAQRGLDVPLTEIARQAGVGIATLYRRFPTSEDLILAVFAAKMEAYAATAETALEVEDPWEGFCDYVRWVCRMQAEDMGFADILSLAPREAFTQQSARAFRAFTRLTRRAQQAGALREDFAHQDLVLLMMANAGLVRATGGEDPRAWRRLVEYMLQAFRAPAAGPLPLAPAPRDIYDALQGSAAPPGVTGSSRGAGT